MKFKSDGCGWRDLRIERDGGNVLQTSVYGGAACPDRTFISIEDGGVWVSFDISIKELRKFAKAILKETEK